MDELRHAESDAERCKKPEWLIVIGVCTHLGKSNFSNTNSNLSVFSIRVILYYENQQIARLECQLTRADSCR